MAINYAHLGNGITVWDNSIEDPRTRDYLKIAHIGTDREVTFYKKLPAKDVEFIINIARNLDPEVSITQDTKVFTERPVSNAKIKSVLKLHNGYKYNTETTWH